MTDEQLTRIAHDFIEAVFDPNPDNDEVIRSVQFLVEERDYEERLLAEVLRIRRNEIEANGGIDPRRA